MFFTLNPFWIIPISEWGWGWGDLLEKSMSELRDYLQEYIDILQILLNQYSNDDLMVGKAQEIFKSDHDPRYLVLAQKLAQIKKKASDVKQNDNIASAFKLIDKDTY
ncbi:MAG: hypothetical protein VSS75_026605 [Candidatus Parabeggiatoa sp.]